ncbi:MAG: folate-binding protein [Pseudomonadota bacterium]
MSNLVGMVDETRVVLRMSGNDTRDVLQAVVTNDVEQVTPEQAVYAALLTPQGKFLFDFFLLADGSDILIDCAADRAEDLIKRLKMYCLRRQAVVTHDEGLRVLLAWPGEGSSHHPPPPPSPGQVAISVPDPRNAGLGWRLYGKDLPELTPADQTSYDALRVALAVPEGGRELLADETYILEAGFERLNGVDFRKGCYVGQEVTARMKHKTELRKGIVVVEVEGDAPEGTEITGDGKPAGKLFTQAGGRALAHLRFDRAKGALTAGDAILRYPVDAD